MVSVCVCFCGKTQSFTPTTTDNQPHKSPDATLYASCTLWRFGSSYIVIFIWRILIQCFDLSLAVNLEKNDLTRRNYVYRRWIISAAVCSWKSHLSDWKPSNEGKKPCSGFPNARAILIQWERENPSVRCAKLLCDKSVPTELLWKFIPETNTAGDC